MTLAVEKRRKRRIAADEAHAWARNLRLRNPYAKLVLAMLSLYVNGEGACFVSISQLADDCEFAPETVRRRLLWLESIGAITRMPQWRDDLGRLNSDGRGKRTTDEVRLMLDVDVDEIEAAASGKIEAVEENSHSDTPQISHSPERVANPAPEAAPNSPAPPLATHQPSSCGGGLISEPEPEPEDSPYPLRGSVVPPDGWEEFEKAWDEPILRQTIARQVWSALKPDERTLATKAARGYVHWRKGQKKPPNVINAHTFLRETDAWERFASLTSPAASTSGFVRVPPDSAEGRAIHAIYGVARITPRSLQSGEITCQIEITPQLLALASAPPRSSWPFIDDRQQIGAWHNFVAALVTVARPEFLQTGADGKRGIYAPWPWPPRKDGTLSTTGPPTDALADENVAEIAKTG